MMSGILGSTGGAVSMGWKWAAVGIAFGAVILLFGGAALLGREKGWNALFKGADGIPSTSKFQWLIWLVSILFAYIALWVLRAKQGDWGAIQNIPKNVLVVLGLSSVTMATAKGVTGAYARSNPTMKSTPERQATDAALPGGLLKDDDGVPELAKIQMVGFTIIAVGIFLATVIHEIADGNAAHLSLPDIDATLLALMGISQGGYLAKKIVNPPSPSSTPTT